MPNNTVDLKLDRGSLPDVRERELAVRWALGAKLRELGHATTGTGNVDGFTLFEIAEQRSSGYSWQRSSRGSNRLRIKVAHYRTGWSHFREAPRQFPEPNKGFDIDKIAAIISEHTKRATELRDHENQRQSNEYAGRQLLWRAVRSFGLPEHSGETSYNVSAVHSELVEKYPAQLRNGYAADGKHGQLKLTSCTHSGTVTVSVAIKTKDAAELHAIVERLTELAGVEHHVCDRDALGAERKAKWEAELAAQQAEIEARDKGNNDD
jgi:uncharacterized protein YeaO (DUF488 family)